jgi:NAD(P)-dependent dehydrogenase (short-subunit alcohol dehydrogenase family)
MNVLITGTSRGIGLELCRQGLVKGHQILAVARHPESSKELSEMQRQNPSLRTLAVELTNPEAPAKITSALREWNSLDLLINNAGILTQGETTEDFLRSFHVNSIVPFLVTKAALPFLKNSRHPKAIHITSQMGSIADNKSGGYYAYRSSKSALNMINKSLSIDHDWLCSVVMHPGWVQTDMGGAGAPTSPEESASGLWRVIEGLRKEDSGAFFNFKGDRLTW